MLGPSRTPPTDLFDKRFTNRVGEIRHFLGLLNLPETELVKIHFYRGVTGAGKSHLLTKFEKLCRERSVGVLRIDLDPERQGTPTIDRAALAARLVHAWDLSAPRTRHALMRIALIESQALWSQSELAKELGSQAAGVSSDILLKNWDSFSIGGFVAAGFKTAIGAAKEWRSLLHTFLRSDEGKADELYFRGNPTAEEIREDLFRRLGLDFQDHPAGERQNRAVRAALLIDSLEKASGSHDWIWDIFQNFADANRVPRLLVLGAGQTVPELSPAAADYVETVFLDGFLESDARQYIEEKRRIDPSRTGDILEASLESGEPVRYHVFSLGLSCDTVLLDPTTNLNDLGTASQLSEDELKDGYTRELAVVNRFMRAISDPLRRRYMRRLALTPVWDDEAVGFAFERNTPDQRRDILNWLAPFSFITRRTNGTSVMHGAIRRCLLATNDPDDTARWHAEWAEYWRERSGEEDGGTSEAYWHHRLLMPDGINVWAEVTEARRLSLRMQDHSALVDRLESHLESMDRATTEVDWAVMCFQFGNEAQQVTVGPDRARAAVAAYRSALEVYTREALPANWAMTQNNLGSVLRTLGERTNDADLLQQAVAAYRSALEVRTREALPANWAMTQNNLGNVLRTLGERTNDADLLQQAVAAYRSALEVYTREALPADWAMTQNNLGNVLQTMGERTNDADLLQQAVAAYRSALEVYTREALPADWAMTQNNLGNVLQTMGKRTNDTDLLQQAVAAYRSALEVRTREALPANWAMTQNNLGNVLRTLGERTNDADLLQQAVAAYRSALEVRTREALPADWAMTQNNLGNVLRTLGERTNDADLLQQAVAAYRSALEVYTREALPADWAMTQNNLGNVLQTMGERTNDADLLQQAVAAYRSALEVYTREALPADWAMTQNNLGNVLQTMGKRTNDADLVQQAVAAYRSALEVRTREALPANWAMTQNNLGNVLRTLGERTNDADLLQQAVAAYRSALEVYTREALPADWAMTQNNLGNVLQTLGERTNDADLLRQAVAAYRSALEVRTRAVSPANWAMTQNNLGSVLQTLGERTNDTDLLRQAVAAYRSALEVRTREALPADWAMTQNNLGLVLQTLGERTNDADLVQQAVAAYRSALEVRTREALPADWAMTQNNLGLVLQTLGERTNDADLLRQAVAALRGALHVFQESGHTHYAEIVAKNLAQAEELVARLSRPAE